MFFGLGRGLLWLCLWVWERECVLSKEKPSFESALFFFQVRKEENKEEARKKKIAFQSSTRICKVLG